MDDAQHEQAHERVNSNLNMSSEMEKLGWNGTDLELENNPGQFYPLSDTNNQCTNVAGMMVLQSARLNIRQSTSNNIVATRFISIVKPI